MYKKSIICLLITSLAVTACTAGKEPAQPRNQATQNNQTTQNTRTKLPARTQPGAIAQSNQANVNFQVDQDVYKSKLPSVQDLNTGLWVPLSDAASAFGFTADFDKKTGTYRMGYTDVLFETTMNKTQALTGETQIQLSRAPKLINGAPYITTQALSELWQTPIAYNQANNVVQVTPMDAAAGEPEGVTETAPSKSGAAGTEEEGVPDIEGTTDTKTGTTAPGAAANNGNQGMQGAVGNGVLPGTQGRQGTQGTQGLQGGASIQNVGGTLGAQNFQMGIQRLRDINMNALIRYGNRYLGTPYKWGSSRYTTRTFDCSSFVKRVYGHFGINLPRGARDQSKRGYRVAYRNMKKGDLMFFWIHKRRAVGHVGIYAGNGRVLHTFGKGGVRYSNVRYGYWRYHFYFAKRIAR